jgi:pimeloyl-ACP methyl ester carboxylesterase
MPHPEWIRSSLLPVLALAALATLVRPPAAHAASVAQHASATSMAPAASSPLPTAGAVTPALRLEPYAIELPGGGKVDGEQGTLVVPARRARPDGRSFELHVVRIPGTAGDGGVPTLFLAGGPGENATGMLRHPQATAVVAAFRSVGDLVLLDQRGTGRSRPQPTCAPREALPDFAFVDGAAMLARTHQAVALCAAEWRAKGVDAADFDSREAADDVDDLRRALGHDRVNLVGFSYGTHLALTLMQRHPEGLGRVVLIGTEGLDHTWKLPSTYDQQLRKLSLLAAADPAIGAQVPDMLALLRQVLAQLEREPVTVTVRDRAGERDVRVPVGRWGLLRILRWDVGDGNDFVALPAMLHAIAHGDTALLARYVEKRWNQLGRGTALMPVATDCASGASPQRRGRIAAESPGSVFGAVTNYPFPEVCAALGDPDLGVEHRAPLVATIPTLLVSGTLDSNTPPFQAEEVRWGLTSATHLVVENAGHEDTLAHPEVQRALFAFLAGQDVAERRITLPRPRFLSLAAAKDFRP